MQDIRTERQKIDEFLQVAAVEEYGRRHNMQTSDVLTLSSQYDMLAQISAQYDVLHMLDPDEACDFAEDYIKARQ